MVGADVHNGIHVELRLVRKALPVASRRPPLPGKNAPHKPSDRALHYQIVPFKAALNLKYLSAPYGGMN